MKTCRTGSRLRRLGMAIGAAALLGLPAAQAQDAPIKIGVALEMSGRLALYGESGRRGIEMASEAFGNTIANGRKIEFIFRDVQSEAAGVITSMTELANSDKVNFVIGPCGSPMISAAIPNWLQTKPVWMQFCGTSPRLREAVGAEDRFFHTYAYSNTFHEVEAIAFKALLGPGKKAVVIYSDDDLGRGHIADIEKYYAQHGIEVLAKEVIRVGTTDFNPVLTKLARLNPDILVAMVQGGDIVALAKQVYARKFPAPYRVATSSVQFETFAKAAGEEAQDGWISTSTYMPGLDRPADPKYGKLFPSAKDWEERFRKKYSREPDTLDVGSYVTAAMLLVAIDRAGADDRDKVVAELQKLQVLTPVGPGRFENVEGTKNQAFSGNMMLFQRQKGKPVTLYPADVAQGKLTPTQTGQ